jgi:hypothetical protein
MNRRGFQNHPELKAKKGPECRVGEGGKREKTLSCHHLNILII